MIPDGLVRQSIRLAPAAGQCVHGIPSKLQTFAYLNCESSRLCRAAPTPTPTPKMSIRLPLRSRLFPLQQQCPLQRSLYRVRQPSLSPATRAFSSTPRFYREKANAEQKYMNNVMARRIAMDQIEHAPSILYNQRLEPVDGAVDSMRGKDMGLLDGTMIRAPFSRLPGVLDRRLYSYFWTLFKNKVQSFASYVAPVLLWCCGGRKKWESLERMRNAHTELLLKMCH